MFGPLLIEPWVSIGVDVIRHPVYLRGTSLLPQYIHTTPLSISLQICLSLYAVVGT